MAISVNAVTRVISIPRSDLIEVVAGVLYDLDTDQFRKDLRLWESSEEGRTRPTTHSHNTEYTVMGSTYARKVEIIHGYSVEFEAFEQIYSVAFKGSNNNLADVQNGIFIPNNVIPISTNSAGLQIVTVGSGVLAQDIINIRNAVHNYDGSN